ncbi:phage-related minor tail protein [Thermomonospora umbrina]|uniref:Phage-related minor tail protein n=1 Tax=Thermomonospora umbrina TaxID=111806 RepID=A0A3D9SR92_9ACTN|nr:phage-related minor tail protein [Thermomonospora umbrina]
MVTTVEAIEKASKYNINWLGSVREAVYKLRDAQASSKASPFNLQNFFQSFVATGFSVAALGVSIRSLGNSSKSLEISQNTWARNLEKDENPGKFKSIEEAKYKLAQEIKEEWEKQKASLQTSGASGGQAQAGQAPGQGVGNSVVATVVAEIKGKEAELVAAINSALTSKDIGKGVAEKMATKIKGDFTANATIVGKLRDGINDAITKVNDVGSGLAEKIAQKIAEEFPRQQSKIAEGISKVIGFVGNDKTLLQKSNDVGQAIMLQVARSISQDGSKAGQAMVKGINGGLKSVSDNVENSGRQAAGWLVAGFNTELEARKARLGTTLDQKLRAAFNSAANSVRGAGTKIAQNIVSGLTLGIGEGRQRVARSALKLADSVIDAVRRQLQEKSPSRVMMRSGHNIGDGLAQGMDQRQAKVKSSAKRLANVQSSLIGSKPAATKAGRQIGDALASGISSSRGKVASAMRSVTQPVASGAKSAATGMKPLQTEMQKTANEATKSGKKVGDASKGMKGLGPAGKLAGGGLRAVGAGFNAATGPAGLILTLLSPFIAMLIDSVTKSKTFKKIVSGAMSGVSASIKWIKKAASGVWNWIKKNWPLLLGILLGPFGYAIGKIIQNWDKVKAKLGEVWDALKNGVKAPINAVIDAWNSLDFSISIKIPSWVPGVGGKGFSISDLFPDIPRLAEGGLVRNRPGGTLALIGEGGEDELVVPLSRLSHVIAPSSRGLARPSPGEARGRRYEFHFHGSVKDPEETSRQFAAKLRAWEVLNAVR